MRITLEVNNSGIVEQMSSEPSGIVHLDVCGGKWRNKGQKPEESSCGVSNDDG
jgi:hypothetical protein